MANNSYCNICKSYHDNSIDCDFNPNAPCKLCGQPVIALSVAGPSICPACDCYSPEERRRQIYQTQDADAISRYHENLLNKKTNEI